MARRSIAAAAIRLSGCSCLDGAGGGGAAPRGQAEFQVNTYTTGDQHSRVSRPRPRASSWSSGRATTATRAPRHLRAALRRDGRRPGPGVSGDIRQYLPARTQVAVAASGAGSSWCGIRSTWWPSVGVPRPPLRRNGRAAGTGVSGEHVHDERPAAPGRRRRYAAGNFVVVWESLRTGHGPRVQRDRAALRQRRRPAGRRVHVNAVYTTSAVRGVVRRGGKLRGGVERR